MSAHVLQLPFQRDIRGFFIGRPVFVFGPDLPESFPRPQHWQVAASWLSHACVTRTVSFFWSIFLVPIPGTMCNRAITS